jgi:pyruvate dehydrogenase E2 component (dihydrolipoamide acetyltransferase)
MVVKRAEAAEPRREERVKASPLARRIADEHGVDLHAIRGTGPGGRIVEKDVEAAVAGRGGEAPPAAEQPKTGRVDLSRIRRTTAKRMGDAKREIPHFYASTEIAMDGAVRLADALRALGGDYAEITHTHVLVKAVGLALRRVPSRTPPTTATRWSCTSP